MTIDLSGIRLWSCQKTVAELTLHGRAVQPRTFEQPYSAVEIILKMMFRWQRTEPLGAKMTEFLILVVVGSDRYQTVAEVYV